MPKITKVYTRTGDDGTTGLGSGKRVDKDSPRIEAYGAVDEVSSHVGAALAFGLEEKLAKALVSVQNDLFHLGADLCVPEEEKGSHRGPTVEARHVKALEKLMDELSLELKPLENFILPGGCPGASALHLARAVCRRAERRAVSLAGGEPVGPFVIKYLNRLSDFLFVAARYENTKKGVPETLWDSRA